MADLRIEQQSHRRLNILTGEWLLVSPGRTQRPWQGHKENIIKKNKKKYDSSCCLCPGNKRAGSNINPEYEATFAFNNDFASLKSADEVFCSKNGLLHAEGEQGICRVLCFSPDHSKTVADMNIKEISLVIELWQKEFQELRLLPGINYVQIFENKGEIMGCSNPHPHGQIWAQTSIPNEVLKKDKQQKEYFLENGKSLIDDYLRQELDEEERVVYENEHFVILVPFWAIWPFETMIIPKRVMADILFLNSEEKLAFAESIKKITVAYDKIFEMEFPYSSGIHQAPYSEHDDYKYWHWHMSFYPPLLRSASIKKHMVGYEMFAMPQRDISPEEAARKIKDLID